MNIIPEKGFVCIGPYRRWCGHVHRNKATAKKCMEKEDEWCLRNIHRKSDRSIFDIHDTEIEKKRSTIYYLKPTEEREFVDVTKLEKATKVVMMKALKFIYKEYCLEDKSVLKHIKGNGLNVTDAKELLQNMKNLNIIKSQIHIQSFPTRSGGERKDKNIWWECIKKHDEIEWEAVVNDFIKKVGGL